MDEIELEQRVAVVLEARSWDGTRFHHMANVKRQSGDLGGVDCANLLLEAHAGAGLAERFRPDHYPHDWHMHRDEERFLATLEEYLQRVGDDELPIQKRDPDFYVRPGNVLIWRYGRTFSHGAIVAQWPRIIHASFPAGCVLEESVMGGILEERPMRVYSFWGR
jgi:cell wall-associated NlpC family hydrolase